VYLPGTCLVSFGDDATHTSETKFLKQATGLDLQKLFATHHVYWDVSGYRQKFRHALTQPFDYEGRARQEVCRGSFQGIGHSDDNTATLRHEGNVDHRGDVQFFYLLHVCHLSS
jgi:hypothetical protein